MIRKIVFSFLLMLCMIDISHASHISGGDLSYECLGGNRYRFHLRLYRDCEGVSLSVGSQRINFENNCGVSDPASLTLSVIPNSTTGQNFTMISHLCPEDSLNSTCFGGSLPGMQMYEFVGEVMLPGDCADWIAYWKVCCRNETINVDNSENEGTYLEAKINNENGLCNNSPWFTSIPIPYVCVNQPVIYNFGVVEPDGDNVVYRFIQARETNATTYLDYVSPYTPTDAITGITLDPGTGELQFTPTVIGNFIVVIEVSEYNSSGILVGTVMRDIQFVVQNCSNQLPIPSGVAIFNHTGAGTVVSANELQVCEGDFFCYELVFPDPDIGDALTLSTNIDQVLPGATFSYTGTNPVTARICWQTPAGTPTFNSFSIDISDDACPISGKANYTGIISVVRNTSIVQPGILCLGDSHEFEASGGSTFNWNVISGDSIIMGDNFSCNPCANPIAQPTVTTVYEVVSNLSGGCSNKDTVQLEVVPDFTYTILQSDLEVCKNEPVTFNITTNPVGAYSYNWSPPALLSANNIPNPQFIPNVQGAIDFSVLITSADGCEKNDTIGVFVNSSTKPVLTSVGADETLLQCDFNTVLHAHVDTLVAEFSILDDFDDGFDPVIWDVASSSGVIVDNNCGSVSGTAARFQGDVARRSITTFPMETFKCSVLEFCLKPASGSGAGCNSPESNEDILLEYSDDYGSTWTLISNYDESTWTSDVFICFNVSIPSAAKSNDIQFRWRQEAFTSGSAQYDVWVIDNVSIKCYSTDSYSYNWSPAVGMTNPNMQHPPISPPSTMTYQVVVTDTLGGCSDTGSVVIIVDNQIPEPNFVIDTNEGCYPTSIQFTNVTDPSKVSSCTWDFGDGNILSDCGVGGVVEHAYDYPGTYNVGLTVVSAAGCDSTIIKNELIVIHDYPKADFYATPQPTTIENSEINFVNISEPDTLSHYWEFGINQSGFDYSSTDFEPTIIYPSYEGGTYEVMLAVTSDKNCSDTVIKEVVIDDLYAFFIPNSFTPNGDGFNDIFIPKGMRITEDQYSFRVFDRWGSQIFETSSPTIGWDGRVNNGNIAPIGVYIWRISTVNQNTKRKLKYNGSVTIIK